QNGATVTRVSSLAVWDDGLGPALYVGGYFTKAGASPASCIAKWKAGQWSALGSGVTGSIPSVFALAPFDGALHVGGRFDVAGGAAAQNIATWDGSTWSSLAGSGGGASGDVVDALAVFDDGGGPALFVGGNFEGVFASGPYIPSWSIAKWNGASWSSLGKSVAGTVNALGTYDDGTGPALYVGGYFVVGAGGDSSIAKWGSP
ncbi:MAG TPA: hypothetical protein VKE69_00190, partial [Planctomycetota bacterium]|nr:hypothetical protein [Planctomycetota bacterium]